MADELDTLAAAILKLGEEVKDALPSTGSLAANYGWNCPPLDREQMYSHAENVSLAIKGIDRTLINKAYKTDHFILRIDEFKSSTMPYLSSGNASGASIVYFQLLDWIRTDFVGYFEQQVNWEKVAEANRLPKQFANRLRSMEKLLTAQEARAGEVKSKIDAIDSAHEAAINLPTDLETMREAREFIAEMKRLAEKDQAQAGLAGERIQKLLSNIALKEQEAIKLVENTEDAYSAATTKGLGEAFQQRADRLSQSMWTWVAGLTIALIAGAAIGIYRVNVLQGLVEAGTSSDVVWLNILLAFLSVAAPVWFAWIATKQIGHRFRLSEDYAFKASVAKAYEGYRREAARLDPKFAKRLFASALDRLDEAPIRFVEHETPGSPFQDIFKFRRNAAERGQTTAPSSPMPPASPKPDAEDE